MTLRHISVFQRLVPCMATLCAAGILLSGCVATSVPDSLKTDETEPSRMGKFYLRNIVHDIPGQYIREQDWPALRNALGEMGVASEGTLPADRQEAIPFELDVRDSREDNVPGKEWTAVLFAFSLGLFPGIITDASTCSVRIDIPETEPVNLSGTITWDTWGCWFTLPWAFFPKDEEAEKVEILAKAITAQLTEERYEAASAAIQKRKKEEEEERRAAEERERREVEERRIAEERARREEEERIAAADRARLEEEQRWLARKDNPAYKFPLRGTFPSSTKLYKEFSSGCSLQWALDFIAHSKDGAFAPIEEGTGFAEIATHLPMECTAKPLPKAWDGIATGTSLFICNSTNVVFREDGRVVALTFGEIAKASGAVTSVLVGCEVYFEDGTIPTGEIRKKYQAEFPGARPSESLVEASDFGVKADVVYTELVNSDFKAVVLDVKSVKSVKEDTTEDATSSVIGVAMDSDNLYDAAVAASAVEAAMAFDFLSDIARSETKAKKLKFWRSRIGKPVVSLTDTQLLASMIATREAEIRAEEARRLEAEKAAEEAKRRETEQRLNAF